PIRAVHDFFSHVHEPLDRRLGKLPVAVGVAGHAFPGRHNAPALTNVAVRSFEPTGNRDQVAVVGRVGEQVELEAAEFRHTLFDAADFLGVGAGNDDLDSVAADSPDGDLFGARRIDPLNDRPDHVVEDLAGERLFGCLDHLVDEVG